MSFWAYQLFFILVLPIVLFYQLLRKDLRSRLLHFYGRFRFDREDKFHGKSDWFHAVSLGETRLILSFIQEGLKKGTCSREISFTTTIQDALDLFVKESRSIQGVSIRASFLPLDLSLIMNSFVRRLNPKRVFLSETDFWPGMLRSLDRNQVPVYLINGRISKGVHSFFDLSQGVAKTCLNPIKKILLQYEVDRERLPFNFRSKAHVLGNAKFDLLELKDLPSRYRALKNSDRPVVLYGSIHPDEWEVVLTGFHSLPDNYLHLIVPRNLNTIPKFRKLLKDAQENIPVIEDLQDPATTTGIALINETGVLNSLYQLCQLAIIGGSFNQVGGHNFLEPILYRKVVIIGPNMRNFSNDSQEFTRKGLIYQANDLQELARIIASFHSNPRPMIENSMKAFQALEEKRGVLSKSWEIIGTS